MTISSELDLLKKAKTAVRKSIQRKGTGLTLAEIFPNYHTYIHNMTDVKSPDETGLIDYAEDRCYFLELNVSKIRPYAFRQYTCLKQLYLSSSETVVLENLNAFYGIEPEILVPSSLVDSYKSANNWNKISDRIKAFESAVIDEMYLIQHIDKVQTLGWITSKKISEIQKDFR